MIFGLHRFMIRIQCTLFLVVLGHEPLFVLHLLTSVALLTCQGKNPPNLTWSRASLRPQSLREFSYVLLIELGGVRGPQALLVRHAKTNIIHLYGGFLYPTCCLKTHLPFKATKLPWGFSGSQSRALPRVRKQVTFPKTHTWAWQRTLGTHSYSCGFFRAALQHMEVPRLGVELEL